MPSIELQITKLKGNSMGLAASQARFLAITARKMNCEFQSMQIAQEKLSVTRDLQKAAENYQTALGATKLVWDTADNDIYDLSYDVMMTPTTLNEFNPYFITDPNGKILLSNAMFIAAKNAGIIDANGNPTGNTFMGNTNSTTDSSRNAFLYQLSQSNQIESSIYNSIKSLGALGYTQSGIGGAILDKTSANGLKTNEFIDYMKTTTYESYALNGKPIPTNKTNKDLIYVPDLDSTTENSTMSALGYTQVVEYSKIENGTESGNYMICNLNNKSVTMDKLTLGDIISSDYAISYVSGDNNLSKDIFIENILKKLVEPLGYGANIDEYKGLNVSTSSANILQKAYDLTLAKLKLGVNETGTDTVSSLSQKAKNTNNHVDGRNNIITFSLTNALKTYLTYFAMLMDGFGSEYSVGDTRKGSNYVTNDIDYYFIMNKDSAVTNQDMLNADFYNILYNNIATYGAISDESAREIYTKDKSNLQQALKTGRLFISSLHNDGYYYQGPYTSSGHVAETVDEEAVARAEVEYNIQKSKLNSKEESLELKMKNLDMEISALTTEFDTVKNLISKNIEKVFTMFST